MECKVIYKKLKNYCSYLFDIGLLTSSAIDKFINTFNLLTNYSSRNNQILSNNNYNLNKFKDLLSNSLIFLFNSFNEDQKMQIARNIYIKYEEKTNYQYELLFNKISKIQKNVLLRNYLKKWKIQIENIIKIYPFSSLLRGKRNYDVNITDINKRFFKNKTFNNDKSSNSNDNTTSINYNNLRKKKNNTYNKTDFKKMIYRYPLISEINNSFSMITKKNNNNTKKNKNKSKSPIKINLINDSPIYKSQNNFFKSRFISTSVKKNKDNFQKKFRIYNKKKENQIKNMKKEIEKNFNSELSFIPKLISSNSYRIKQTSFQNLKESSSSGRHLNKCKSYINVEHRKEKNAVNYQKLFELYNDYKKLKNKINKKREKVNNELGITFKPKLISDKKYFDKIIPDFYERENIFLAKKNNFIGAYKKYLDIDNTNKKKTKNKNGGKKNNDNKNNEMAKFIISINEDEKDKKNGMEEDEKGYIINVQEIIKMNNMKKSEIKKFLILTNENDKSEDKYKDSSLLPLSAQGTLQTS